MTPAVLAVLAAVLFTSRAGAAAHPPTGGEAGCLRPSCHDGIVVKGPGGSAHEPVVGGECVACHDLDLPPGGQYVLGKTSTARSRSWEAELCAGCHAGPATGFHEGGRDLHALHVRAALGGGCVSCHAPHASAQARLLRPEIPGRGGVKILQRFETRPRGGWCRTGCHAPKEYER